MNEHNSTEEIGGVAYVTKYGDLYIPYITLYIIGFIIGTTGNALIMISIVITKELHNNPTNILIFNLSAADIIVSAFVDCIITVGALVGKKFFDNVHIFCQFIGAVCVSSCVTSMLNIGFLSFNRYINICHHHLYLKIFTTKKTILYCLLTWILGLLVDLPNFFGWGRHAYSVSVLSCLWDRSASHGYSLFFPLVSVVIPSICVFIFYLKIFVFVRKSKEKVAHNNHGFTVQISIAKGLFTTFMLFTVCWLPYGFFLAIIVMSDWYYTYPVASEIYTLLVGHLNSSFNPIVYWLFNPAFRKGYMNVLRLITRRKVVNKSKQQHTVQFSAINAK